MLMQSDYAFPADAAAGAVNIAIELLPALPEPWKDGSVSGLRARGGITVDMTWEDSRVTSLSLVALRACKVTVSMNGQQRVLKLKKGRNDIRI